MRSVLLLVALSGCSGGMMPPSGGPDLPPPDRLGALFPGTASAALPAPPPADLLGARDVVTPFDAAIRACVPSCPGGPLGVEVQDRGVVGPSSRAATARVRDGCVPAEAGLLTRRLEDGQIDLVLDLASAPTATVTVSAVEARAVTWGFESLPTPKEEPDPYTARCVVRGFVAALAPTP